MSVRPPMGKLLEEMRAYYSGSTPNTSDFPHLCGLATGTLSAGIFPTFRHIKDDEIIFVCRSCGEVVYRHRGAWDFSGKDKAQAEKAHQCKKSDACPKIAADILAEVNRADTLHGPFPTIQHAAAVLRREEQEAWAEVWLQACEPPGSTHGACARCGKRAALHPAAGRR